MEESPENSARVADAKTAAPRTAAPKTTAPPTGVLFDQASRYASLAQAVQAMLPAGGTVLDVGSGALTLLRRYLPDHRVTFIDPLLAGSDDAGSIGRPFDDDAVAPGSFDVVVCVDVLEHVPTDQREAFLQRMIRTSRRGVIVSAPFADGGQARQTDDQVQLTYRAKQGRDYPWLAEHEQHGLPSMAATQALLQQAGLQVATMGNGHVPWLDELLSLHVVLLDEPAHRPLLQRIGDRFAANLLRFDHLTPTYRHLLVANREGLVELPSAADDQQARADARQAWSRFRAWMNAELAHHVDSLAKDVSGQRHDNDKLRRLVAKVTAQRDEFDRVAKALSEQCNQQQHSLVLLQRSLSWRLTVPLRAAGRLVGGVLDVARRATLSVAHWSVRHLIPARAIWPLKTAFFTCLRPLLRHTREYAEFEDARRWRDPRRQSHPPKIDAGHATLPDVVVFGVIGWAFRIQRPQQLALELARRGHRLFYLAPGFIEARTPGYSITRIDASLPLYEVRLHAHGRLSIYNGAPAAGQAERLLASLQELLHDVAIGANIAIVDHPGWVDLAAALPRSRLVYDCMDNHHGFAQAGTQLPADERRLVEWADTVIVTSNVLHESMHDQHRHVAMVRNACDPAHFANTPRATGTRPVIGYFGAMAEWFDVELLRHAAKDLAHCDFVLVGDDTAGVRDRLDDLRNVRFTGEVPYADLPQHVGAMDVLVIPFVIDELTLATNPVKAYEALAAGKPVVATAMPELMNTHLAPFVRIATCATTFVHQIAAALAEAHVPELRDARVRFANEQSWQHRAAALEAAIASAPRPKVCAIVVSWNGVDLTRRCLRSLLDDPAAVDLEVIVVDNHSTDATPALLDEIEADPRVRTIRNADNLGFAAACNQGLAAGAERDPELLVILNNDIVVTPGWALTLHRHVRRDPSIGLIGPVTNNIGNEARIETAYRDLDAMLQEQAMLTGKAAGRTFDIRVLAFFCVAIPRDVYTQVGGLDTNFGTGFFEDDDYCQRVRDIGRRIVCAEDVFVHHELSASFDKIDQGERQRLFERNKAYYESKWGPWQRHSYRPPVRRGNAAAG